MERKGCVVFGIIVFILLGLMGILFGGEPVEELPVEFETEIATEFIPEENTEPYSESIINQKSENPVADMTTIPAYSGNAYVSVNNDVPYLLSVIL
ncbi:MAG: hypothetical protein ACI3XA_07065 [Clostridia bacterium]